MQLAPLTFKSIRARAVVLKLRRPVVARIATITDWPMILIDLARLSIGCSKVLPHESVRGLARRALNFSERIIPDYSRAERFFKRSN